jgi:uncharacterized protein YjbI with pentapeptide repeats
MVIKNMADREQLGIIRKGAEAWNTWRQEQPPSLEISLQKASLRNLDLSRANLSQANLSMADLVGANLKEADLRGANLIDVYLVGAILEKAKLSSAKLTGANLNKANLEEAALYGTDMEEARLEGAQLDRAKLNTAILFNAKLNNAHLVEADLSKANLIKAELQKADLSKARLRNAKLRKTILSEANLSEADLVGADLRYATLDLADLQKADFRKAILSGIDLSGANLEGADLRGANLQEAILIGANLKDTKLDTTNLQGALIDEKTTWPDTFDYRKAIEVIRPKASSTIDSTDEPKEQPEIGGYLSEEEKAVLNSIEDLTKTEVAWIINNYALSDKEEFLDEQKRELEKDIFYEEIIKWMENIFEHKINKEELEEFLTEIKRQEKIEIQEDKIMWNDIQSLPEEERETLEKIDILRRKLREWCRTLPEEIIERLLSRQGGLKNDGVRK